MMIRTDKPIRIGARGSRLSITQAILVIEKLRTAWPELLFELKIVKTTGDKDVRSSLSSMGGGGIFIKELETALLRKEIDTAVHSAKDLPSKMPEEFTLAAVPERAPVEDALITINGAGLAQLNPGAKLATGSPRRQALIRAYRPNLHIVDVRGNVDTRLQKLKRGDFDGIVLARAGLMRLGLDYHIVEVLSPEIFTPARGQGALAMETRTDDDKITKIVEKINSNEDHAALLAERSLLAALQAGCSIPVGGWARCDRSKLQMDAVVLSPDGLSILRSKGEVDSLDKAEELGKELARDLIAQGAKEILEDER